MKRYNFRLDSEDKELVKWLDELVQKNEFSTMVRTVLKFVQENGLEELQTVSSLKIEKLKADIRYKNFQSEFLQLRMKYDYHFDSKPSKSAITALKTHAEEITGYSPVEEKKIEDIIDKKWNNYVSELKVMRDGWKIICKICSTGFLGHKSKETAIVRLKEHLVETHERELVEAQMK